MTQEVAKRSVVELVEIGERRVSTCGWRADLFEQHLREHLATPREQWCDVSCMARTMWGRNTPANRDAVRRSSRRGFRACLGRGLFVVIQYAADRHGKILAWKLFDRGTATADERQYAAEQIQRMQRRKEISEQVVSRALELIAS